MGSDNTFGETNFNPKNMIRIRKSEKADTRTCNWSEVSKEELLKSSQQHIGDVRKGIDFFIGMMVEMGANHDYTKISEIDQFHEDFKTGFKRKDWYEMHQEVERHHLKDPKYVQSDVNLLDIMEMIIDGVMAGMARSGEYRKEEISSHLLRKAFDNTITLLLNNVEITE